MKKQVPPAVTTRRVFKILKRYHPQLVYKTIKIYRSSDIPQYQVIGTPIYYQTVGAYASNGKGHTMEQALASGIVELVERYSCFSYLGNEQNFIVSSMDKLGGHAHVTASEIFSVFPDKTLPQIPPLLLKHASMRWYRGYDDKGKRVLIPFGLLMFMLEGTNGMAAGNTFEEALLQSYCEIVERHCLSLLTDRSVRPTIPNESVTSPVCKSIMDRFFSLGHRVILKDLSNGLGIPVIGVLRIADGRMFLTAGVASSREEALLRALTENSQSDSLRKFRPANTFSFLVKPSPVTAYENVAQIECGYFGKELSTLRRLLKNAGMKPYYIETTHPGIDIPSVFSFMSGSKYFKPSLAKKNTIVGLATESITMKLYDQAKSVIEYGLQHDPQNSKTYQTLATFLR